MEDGVIEVQSLLPPLNLNPEGGPNREDQAEKEDGSVPTEDSSSAKGGIINNIISTLVSPMSPKTTATENGEREGGVGSNSGEGGLISNFVSNFFHQSEEGVVENVKEKEKEKEEDEEGNSNSNSNSGGGGGIIHNIVSHLPASLPDDAVPTADEASILINSLVRD